MGTITDPEAAFRQSFGYWVGNGQSYHDPQGFKGIAHSFKGKTTMTEAKSELQEGINKQNNEMKAISTTTGGAGTAGYALIPVYVDSDIVDTSRKYTPLRELTPRVANMGTTADYNRLTAKGGAVFALEDAALTEANDTYARSSKSIKYMYSVGRITGPSQAATPAYTVNNFVPLPARNAKQLEVVVKSRALLELEENAIVNGSTGTTASWFDGLITQIGVTNTVDKNTSALTLDNLYTAIRYAYDDGGRPNLASCSSDVYTDIGNLLFDQFRYAPTQKLAWGAEYLSLNSMVGQIPIIPSMYHSNTSGSKAIYFQDMTVTEMRVLQDITYQELAKTNDSEKFYLKCYETYVIKAPEFCSSVTEIS